MNDTTKTEAKHSPLPWRKAHNNWSGGIKDSIGAAVTGNNMAEDDVELIIQAVNNHDRLTEENRRMREALQQFSNLAIEPCHKCDGTGWRNGKTGDGCLHCGGMGELVMGFPSPQDVRTAKRVLNKGQ